MDIENLNNIRKRRGLSVDELAKLSNLPKSTVEKILFGITKHPRIDTVAAIERALGLPACDTYETGQKEKAPQGVPAGLTEDERILLDYYRRLVPANKITVFNLLKSVFKEASDLPVDMVSDFIGAYYN